MLGVFLLLTFNSLGHNWQGLLSPCDGMHACTDLTSVYTLIRKSLGGNGVRIHVNSKGKIRSTGKILPRGGSNPRRCIQQDSEPNTPPTSYSGPCRPARQQTGPHCLSISLVDLPASGNFLGRPSTITHSVYMKRAFYDNFCEGRLRWNLHIKLAVSPTHILVLTQCQPVLALTAYRKASDRVDTKLPHCNSPVPRSRGSNPVSHTLDTDAFPPRSSRA